MAFLQASKQLDILIDLIENWLLPGIPHSEDLCHDRGCDSKQLKLKTKIPFLLKMQLILI